jgi:hypothetical protein
VFTGLRGKRSSACISDMRFDAWFAHELDAAQLELLKGHLRGCEVCRQRELELLRDRARFEDANPAAPAWLEAHARSAARKWLWSGLSAAAAVAVLAFLASPHERAGIRAKGGDSLSFYVRRGTEVHRGQPRESVLAGDKLRFAYTAPKSRYLTILSLDGAGHASVYYPAGTNAAPIHAGSEVLLSSAVELDEVLGEERILAFFCDDALPIAPLLAELQQKRMSSRVPQACTRSELVIFKQAP